MGNSPSANLFTYQAPIITSFAPAVGPTSGNLPIEIYGTSLKAGMTVNFGDLTGGNGYCGRAYQYGLGATHAPISPREYEANLLWTNVFLAAGAGTTADPQWIGEVVRPGRASQPGRILCIQRDGRSVYRFDFCCLKAAAFAASSFALAASLSFSSALARFS